MTPPAMFLGIIALIGLALMIYVVWVKRGRSDQQAVAYDLIYASLSDAVLVLDSGRRIVSANPAAERVLGVSRGRLINQPLASLMPQVTDPDWFTDSLVRFEISGDGGAVYLGKCQPMTLGKQPSGWLMVLHDVTAQRHAEAELSQSERRARALLDAIPDMMVRFNRSGIIIDYKANPKQLFGLQPHLSAHASYTFMPTFGDRIEARVAETLRLGITTSYEFQYPMPSGGVRDYVARLIPDGADEVVGIVQDVTERKQVAREAAALALERERAQVMTEFIHKTMHDFREPVQAMQTITDALRHTPNLQQRAAYIIDIDAEADKLSAMVNDLLHTVSPLPAESNAQPKATD